MAIQKVPIPSLELKWSPSDGDPLLQLLFWFSGNTESREYVSYHSVATWSKIDDPKEVQEYLLDLSRQFSNLSNELSQAALEAGPFLAGEMGVCASRGAGTLTANHFAAPCR